MGINMENAIRRYNPLSRLRFGLKEAMWICEAPVKYSKASNEKRLFRLAEAAMYLGLSKGSLYKLAWQGRLPFVVRFGRLLFFDRPGMDSWIEENTHQIRL